jgi:hypothetical protein
LSVSLKLNDKRATSSSSPLLIPGRSFSSANTWSQSGVVQEKDDLMQKIRQAVNENIHEILASQPGLQERVWKTMERMKRNETFQPRRKRTRASLENYTKMDNPMDEHDAFLVQPSSFHEKQQISEHHHQLNKRTTTALSSQPRANFMDLLDQAIEEDCNREVQWELPSPSDSVSEDLTSDESSHAEKSIAVASSVANFHEEAFEIARPEPEVLLSGGDHISLNAQEYTQGMSLMDLLDEDELDVDPSMQSQGVSQAEFLPDAEVDDVHTSTDLANNIHKETSEQTNPGDYSSFMSDDFLNTADFSRHKVSHDDVISHGVALLASMSEKEWHTVYCDENEDHEQSESSRSIVDVEDELVILDDEDDETKNSTEKETDEQPVEQSVDQEVPDTHMSMSIKEDDGIMPKVESLIQDLFDGNLKISTSDCNLLLLLLASSSEYENEAAVEMIMQIYSYMILDDNDTPPDGFTYSIVIPSLVKRGEAPSVAANIISDMILDTVRWSNPEAVVQAMRCLELYRKLDKAEHLLRHILNSKEGRTVIPVQAVTPILRMYKAERKSDEVMDLIDDYIYDAGLGPHISELISEVISWPRFSKKGERIDNRTFQTFLFNLLKILEREQSRFSRPSNKMWKRMITELAKSAPTKGHSAEVAMIHEIIWLLLKRDLSYWPDDVILKYGLEISARQEDSNLAVELLQRVVNKPTLEEDWSSSDMNDASGAHELVSAYRASRPPFPPQALILAMQTCVSAKDVSSISSLLSLLDLPELMIPLIAKQELLNQAVRGYAGAHEFARAKMRLNELSENGLNPSDETLGTFIHQLVVDQKADEATQLFQEVKNKRFGEVTPGPACFGGKMFALLQQQRWSDVIQMQSEMREAGFGLNSVALQGVILASTRMDDHEGAMQAISEAVKAHVHLDQPCFEQIMKCLLPDLAGREKLQISEVRQKLRTFADTTDQEELMKAYMDLSRSLRVAEVEEERQKSRNIRQEEIDTRRQESWEKAHLSLIELYKMLRSR